MSIIVHFDHYKKADVFGLRRNFVGDRKQIATIRSSTLSVDKKRQLGDECVGFRLTLTVDLILRASVL